MPAARLVTVSVERVPRPAVSSLHPISEAGAHVGARSERIVSNPVPGSTVVNVIVVTGTGKMNGIAMSGPLALFWQVSVAVSFASPAVVPVIEAMLSSGPTFGSSAQNTSEVLDAAAQPKSAG